MILHLLGLQKEQQIIWLVVFSFTLHHHHHCHQNRPSHGGFGSIFTVFDAIIFRVRSKQVIAPNTKPVTTKYAKYCSLEVQAANMA
jgi:hypothetical protein